MLCGAFSGRLAPARRLPATRSPRTPTSIRVAAAPPHTPSADRAWPIGRPLSRPSLTPEAPHCGPTPVRTNIAQNLATSKLLFLRVVSQFEFLRGGFHSCEDDAADDGSAQILAIRRRHDELVRSTHSCPPRPTQ